MEDYIIIIKNKLESIFNNSIEKYIFLKYSYDELKISLSDRLFTIENEYVIVKALQMWLKYDLNNIMKYSKVLFKLIHIHRCSNTLILSNTNIDTGNIMLDKII